jgi:hypothetical protein
LALSQDDVSFKGYLLNREDRKEKIGIPKESPKLQN